MDEYILIIFIILLGVIEMLKMDNDFNKDLIGTTTKGLGRLCSILQMVSI
jgi:hypothetical protein